MKNPIRNESLTIQVCTKRLPGKLEVCNRQYEIHWSGSTPHPQPHDCRAVEVAA